MKLINDIIDEMQRDELRLLVQIQKANGAEVRSKMMTNTMIPLKDFNTAINSLALLGVIDQQTQYTGKRGPQATVYYLTSLGDEVVKELTARKVIALS